MNKVTIISSPPPGLKSGQLYKFNETDIYILARVGQDIYNFINLQTGEPFFSYPDTLDKLSVRMLDYSSLKPLPFVTVLEIKNL